MVSLLILGSVSSAAGLTYSYDQGEFKISAGTEGAVVSWSKSEAEKLSVLPVDHRCFFVSAGRLDSVSAIRTLPFSLGSMMLATRSNRETTFAGDETHDADYYAELLEEAATANAPRFKSGIKVDRMKAGEGGGEIVTVAVYPIGQDEQTGELIGYQQIELIFYGNPELEIRELKSTADFREVFADAGDKGVLSQASQAPGVTGAEYMVVTASSLMASFAPLLLWKEMKGLTTEIVSIEDVVATTAGEDDAARLRNYLIAAYASGTRYVLLGGDETIIPIRYAYHHNATEPPALDVSQICDLYYGDIDGDWDVDGDGVYGEPSEDNANLIPELLVGRLPANTPAEVAAYVDKLIKYEQNPNGGDYDYLTRSLYIAADQMRDYQGGAGQHQLLAEVFPSHFSHDLSTLIEKPTGDAEYPAEPTAPSAIERLSEGWGIVSLLVHGSSDGFVMRSHEYNKWPKSYIFTRAGISGTHGYLPEVTAGDKVGVVYSVGCSNGAFDMDSPPFSVEYPCVAESFLLEENGGAVAFIGYSRWGWVSSSWKLEKAFLEHLFDGNGNVAAALNYSKAQYAYYRDLAYGLNLYGDPELTIWTESPKQLALEVPNISDTGLTELTFRVTEYSAGAADVLVSVTRNGEIVTWGVTGTDGSVTLTVDCNADDSFIVYAVKTGHATAQQTLAPQFVLDADDDNIALPHDFALHQNYPNPFNPTTRIIFDITSSGDVSLEVFNILGQKVTTLVTGYLVAGRHEKEWDGCNDQGRQQSSGIYLARIVTAEKSDVIKMTLLK